MKKRRQYFRVSCRNIVLTIEQVLSEEDPSRPDQRSESHEEPEEEPDPAAHDAKDSLGVAERLPPQLAVRDGVDPDDNIGVLAEI